MHAALRPDTDTVSEPAVTKNSSSIWTPEDISWLTQPRPEPFDLRVVTRAMGRVGGPVGACGPRYRAAELLDLEMAAIPPGTAPLSVDGVVDGIQRTLVLKRREHRPITLFYVSAGSCVGTKLTAVAERLSVVCSHRDLQWVLEQSADLPVTVLDEHLPSGVEAETMRTIDLHRRAAERHIVESGRGATLLVDGPVRQYAGPGERVGVVKSLGDQLWIPASLLPAEFAHRSPMFRIPAESRKQVDVHSCYLRIQPTSAAVQGSAGVIRLETTNPDLMEPLCAYAVRHRQQPDSGDARWPVHLSSVRAVEDVLRSRSPLVFGS